MLAPQVPFGPELPVQEPVTVTAPTVVSIRFEGQRRNTAESLSRALGQVVGQPRDDRVIDEGIGILWKIFHVRVDDILETRVEGGVALLVLVTELPVDLEARFIGNDEIDTEELLEWGQLKGKRELYLHEAPRVRQRILEGYRREGYYFAQVEEVIREGSTDADGKEIAPDVIFQIVEGPQVHVKKVIVHGNDHFPDRGFWFWADGIKHLAGVELGGPGIFNWSGDDFVEELLEADLIAMRQVYRDRGYLDAVVQLDRLEFNEERDGVRIHIIVDEGVPYTVKSLRLEAVNLRESERGPGAAPIESPAELLFADTELLDPCLMKPGANYEQTLLQHDRDELREFYGDRGYIDHPSLGPERRFEFLDPRLVYDTEKKTVEVIYRISQGRQVSIREILFSGATHTRDRILRREVIIDEGERADLGKIQRSLRRLTASGYFSDPRNPLEHREPTFRFVPTDDPEWVDLEFIVEEGRVIDFEIAGGVDSNDGLFGLISLSMRNFDITDVPDSFLGMFGEIYRKEAFHGAGQQLDLQFSPGTQVDYSRVRFVEPDIFGTQRKRWLLDLEYVNRDRRFADFTEERITRQVRLGHMFKPQWTVWFGYANADVAVEDIVSTDPTVLPEDLIAQSMQGTTDLRSFQGDLQFRDIDNPMSPRDGIDMLWSNSVYGSVLGGDADFYKSVLNLDLIFPVGKRVDVRPSIKLATGAGLEVPFDETDSTPYTERFFLGGIRTIRGFEFRGVGPNVGDTPIGGQTMVRASVEYGHPLYSVTRPGTYQKVEMLRFLVFLDSGILDPEVASLDFDEARVSYGFGFGLAQPFPLVFNFAWPIKSGPGDRRQVFSFNLSFL